MHDQTQIVTYDDAIAAYGPEMIEAVLRHDRHHHGDDGRPWWLAGELVEAVELVKIESRRLEDSIDRLVADGDLEPVEGDPP